MKKNKIKALSLLLAISLTLSSCSLFSNRSSSSDNSDIASEEDKNNTSLENGKVTDNEVKNPDDQPKNPDNNIEAEEEKEKAEEDKKKAEEDKKKPEEDKKKAEKDKKNQNKKNQNKKNQDANSSSLHKVKVGQHISISKSVHVYTNAADAKSRRNSVKTYPSGQYYIYKIYDGMVNISLNKSSAGGWINPNDVNMTVSSEVSSRPSNNSSVKRPSDNNSKVKSGAKYSWSWLYPGNAGKTLTKYGGVYRLSNGKNIYLTFDNGYEYKKNTSKILNSLSKSGVKAVFFTTSSFMKENPALIRRMVREGHVVGNHTQRHLNHNTSSASAIRADLINWERDYVRIVGANPSVKLFRPPEGKFNETSLSIAQSLGYKTVLWGFAYGDWDTSNQPKKSTALNKLLANNRPGNVLLLHSISDTNVAILESYIRQTRSQGYNFSRLR